MRRALAPLSGVPQRIAGWSFQRRCCIFAACLRYCAMRDVFVVEDETLIRMMVAEIVEDLGHRVIAQAGTIREAEPLARDARFDLAILDINVGGASIHPIALIVEERGLQLLFASGYRSSGLPAPFNERPIHRKPFAVEELGRAIDALLSA